MEETQHICEEISLQLSLTILQILICLKRNNDCDCTCHILLLLQGVGASAEELNNIDKELSELRHQLHNEFLAEDQLLVCKSAKIALSFGNRLEVLMATFIQY